MIRRYALIVLTLLMPIAAIAAEIGKAEGTLTVSGKSHKLTHAWAIVSQTTDGEPIYYVWLTDVALTDKQLGVMPDVFTKEIKEGKMHAIQMTLDKNRALTSTDVYEGDSYPTIRHPIKLDLKTFDGKTIAGRLHLDKPYHDLSGETYQCDVKFSAPLRPQTDFLP